MFPALKSCEDNPPQKLVGDLSAQSKDSVMSQKGLCQNKKVITKHVAIGPVLPVSGRYPLQSESVELKDTQTVSITTDTLHNRRSRHNLVDF